METERAYLSRGSERRYLVAIHEFWVHGNVTRAQREGYFINKLNAGWGAIFKTYGQEWFHIVVPTPATISDAITKVNRISVFFRAVGTPQITAIDVWDGIRGIAQIRDDSGPQGGLPIGGDHSSQIEMRMNTWEIPLVHVQFGLGISINVDFGPQTQQAVPEITFIAAGARFVS